VKKTSYQTLEDETGSPWLPPDSFNAVRAFEKHRVRYHGPLSGGHKIFCVICRTSKWQYRDRLGARLDQMNGVEIGRERLEFKSLDGGMVCTGCRDGQD